MDAVVLDIAPVEAALVTIVLVKLCVNVFLYRPVAGHTTHHSLRKYNESLLRHQKGQKTDITDDKSIRDNIT